MPIDDWRKSGLADWKRPSPIVSSESGGAGCAPQSKKWVNWSAAYTLSSRRERARTSVRNFRTSIGCSDCVRDSVPDSVPDSRRDWKLNLKHNYKNQKVWFGLELRCIYLRKNQADTRRVAMAKPTQIWKSTRWSRATFPRPRLVHEFGEIDHLNEFGSIATLTDCSWTPPASNDFSGTTPRRTDQHSANEAINLHMSPPI